MSYDARAVPALLGGHGPARLWPRPRADAPRGRVEREVAPQVRRVRECEGLAHGAADRRGRRGERERPNGQRSAAAVLPRARGPVDRQRAGQGRGERARARASHRRGVRGLLHVRDRRLGDHDAARPAPHHAARDQGRGARPQVEPRGRFVLVRPGVGAPGARGLSPERPHRHLGDGRSQEGHERGPVLREADDHAPEGERRRDQPGVRPLQPALLASHAAGARGQRAGEPDARAGAGGAALPLQRGQRARLDSRHAYAGAALRLRARLAAQGGRRLGDARQAAEGVHGVA